MRWATPSAARLLASAALLFSRWAYASFDGMDSETYSVPFDVQDGEGNTHNSANFTGRSSGGVPVSGLPLSQSVKSANFQIFPGYLQCLPTLTITSTRTHTGTSTATVTATCTRTVTPSSSSTATRSATPSSTGTATLSSTRSPTPTRTPTATQTPTSSASATQTASNTRTVTPSLTGTITRTATPTPTPSATTTPYPILSLLKSADRSSVSLGDTITYTLAGANAGAVTATALTLWDTLDPHTSYISSSPAGVLNGGVLVWNLGSLGAGQATTVIFSVSLSTGGVVANRASLSSSQSGRVDSNVVNIGYGSPFSPTFSSTLTRTPTWTGTSTSSPTQTTTATGTPSATATVSPSATQSSSSTLSPTMTSTSSTTPTPTGTGTCTSTPSSTETSTATLTASDTGTSTASPTPTASSSATRTATPTRSPTATVTATRTITGTSTASSTPTSSPSPSGTVTPSPTFSGTPSQTPTVSSTASATASATPSVTGTNTASPTPSITPTATCTGTSTVTPQAPGLSIVKNGPASAGPNEVISYSLVVSNAGPGAAASITVDDTLPAALSFAGPGTLKGPNYAQNNAWRDMGNKLIAIGPFSLAAGQSLTVTVQGAVDPSAANSNLTNTAAVVDTAFGVGASSNALITTINNLAPTATSTRTISPTFSASPSLTPSSTATSSATRSATPTRSSTPTRTATVTATPSASASPTASATVTATGTPTPFAQLSLLKSANVSAVNSAGDRITYVLAVSNSGDAGAGSVVLWDTVDPATTFLSGSPAPNGISGNVVSWNLGTLASGASQSFTFTVSYAATGQSVTNRGAASAALVAEVDSNTVNVGFVVAATATPTRTASPTPTASPSATGTETPLDTATATASETPSVTDSATPSASPTGTASSTATATPTPTMAIPMPTISVALLPILGDPWFGGAQAFRYKVAISSAAGSYRTITDFVVHFNSDISTAPVLNDFMGIQAFNVALNGPASPNVMNRWRLCGTDDGAGVEILAPMVAPGDTNKATMAYIFTGVNQNGQGNTITAQAVVYSAAMDASFTATLDTYVLPVAPPPTPAVAASPSPTPLAGEGKIICYPQPAKDNLCFAYHAAVGGELEITLYNAAFKLIGRIEDRSLGGRLETSCLDISALAPGVYFYQAKVGAFAFPMQQFGIAR